MTAASGLSYTAIREYAEQIGRAHSVYDDQGRMDVLTLVNALGGRVVVVNTTESLHVDDDGSFVVYVPPTTSSRRDRFTIAHELGHYFLHWLYPRVGRAMSYDRGGRNRMETEANVFASSLLMPEQAFRAAHEQYGGDVWDLASHFDVSPAAADVRCQVLGLARA
jgi:Zn-dependent peptidase ImmA (M78 family)